MSGKQCWRHFDLIVGTSTGGIIALALGLGVPAARVLQLYKDRGREIFHDRGAVSRLFCWTRGLIRAAYGPEPLRRAIEEVLGDSTLADARTRLVVPAISAATGGVYVYKTPHHNRLRSDYRVKMVDVALSTAAAPTFFPAHQGHNGLSLLDGGLWANNPVMVACTEAIAVLGQRWEDLRVLSVGCVSEPMHASSWKRSGGKLFWAKAAVEWVLHGQSVNAMNQARLLLGAEKIVRVQHQAKPGLYKLDRVGSALELDWRAWAMSWLADTHPW
jgi:uncharacterized protein